MSLHVEGLSICWFCERSVFLTKPRHIFTLLVYRKISKGY